MGPAIRIGLVSALLALGSCCPGATVSCGRPQGAYDFVLSFTQDRLFGVRMWSYPERVLLWELTADAPVSPLGFDFGRVPNGLRQVFPPQRGRPEELPAGSTLVVQAGVSGGDLACSSAAPAFWFRRSEGVFRPVRKERESEPRWTSSREREAFLRVVEEEISGSKGRLPAFLMAARDPEASPSRKDSLALLRGVAGADDDVAAYPELRTRDSLTLPSDSMKLTDLRVLSDFVNLRTLRISGHAVKDVEPLASLTALESLDLSYNQIEDLSPLASPRGLRELRVTSNRIQGLSALGELPRLERLYAEGNRIRDLGPLRNCTGLQQAFLEGNEIVEAGALGRCTALWQINLERNRISEAPDLTPLLNLKQRYLRGNPIRDLGRIEALKRRGVVVVHDQPF